MQNNWLTPDELAARWRMNVGTLGVWRCNRRGPAYNKFGGKVMYSLQDIIKYEEENKITPENNI